MILPDSKVDELISSASWRGESDGWPGSPRTLARRVEAQVLESLPRVKITQQRGIILSHVGLKKSATFKVFLGEIELARFSSPGDMSSGFYSLDEAEKEVFKYGQQVANTLGVPLHYQSETDPLGDPKTGSAKMVMVAQGDANKYCEVLRVLEMEEEGDPVQGIMMLREEVVSGLARIELLKQHLRAVLEVANTWKPDYASKMDRDTIQYANDFLEGRG